MEISQKNLTPQERQFNIDALIHRLITDKRTAKAEAKENYKKPEIQAALLKLREQNAKQRAAIGV
jgi:hypothetical protein